MKNTNYCLLFVYFLCALDASHSWKVNTYKDNRNILEMKFKKYLEERPAFKIAERKNKVT